MEESQVVQSLDGYVEELLPYLKPVEECWQPSDILPDMAGERWEAEIRGIREKAATLSDDALVVLVGNTVTEEALPSYQTWLNRNSGLRDETGASQTPWAIWTRGWTAEERRHGELLTRYLYLSGRVDMRSVDITAQHLIRNGFDVKSGQDAYRSFVYVSFQERATKVSHANTGRLAEKCGDETLSKICSMIAGDEARHEEFYKKLFGKIIETDTDRALVAFESMMRQRIVMPARLMSDGSETDLFTQFAVVAQRSGVYTARHYAEVVQHLVEFWNVASLTALSPEAARAQEFLCGLSAQYLSKADRIQETVARLPVESFSWIFNRAI